jgi:RNA recognition motif-containing protein
MSLDDSDRDERTIYVGNLSEKMTNELLAELFMQVSKLFKSPFALYSCWLFISNNSPPLRMMQAGKRLFYYSGRLFHFLLWLYCYYPAVILGPLERVSIPKEKDGKNKSFGFVTYKHLVAIDYALNIFNGTKMFGRELMLKNRNTSSSSSSNRNSFSNPPAQIHQLNTMQSNPLLSAISDQCMAPNMAIPQSMAFGQQQQFLNQQIFNQQLLQLSSALQQYNQNPEPAFPSTLSDMAGSQRERDYVDRNRHYRDEDRNNPYKRSRASPSHNRRSRSPNHRRDNRRRDDRDRGYHRWNHRKWINWIKRVSFIFLLPSLPNWPRKCGELWVTLKNINLKNWNKKIYYA